jgi:hypothetical protein
MITPKEAVLKAKQYLYEVASDEDFEDLRVEEVELESNNKLWVITLGYFRPRKLTNTSELKAAIKKQRSAFYPLQDEERQGVENRVYKRFKINADSGAVQSMTIREVR